MFKIFINRTTLLKIKVAKVCKISFKLQEWLFFYTKSLSDNQSLNESFLEKWFILKLPKYTFTDASYQMKE